MLLTVVGASFASSFHTMVPQVVFTVTMYVFFLSIVMAGGFEYFLVLGLAELGLVQPGMRYGETLGDGDAVALGVGVVSALGFFFPPVNARVRIVPSSAKTTTAIVHCRNCRLRRARLRALRSA